MNEKSEYPYRLNVQMWVFDHSGRLIVVEETSRVNKRNAEAGLAPARIFWKFPQGGVDDNESLDMAVRRELQEELNITDFEVLAKAKYEHKYDWDKEVQAVKKLRGQHQFIFLIKPNKIDEIKVNTGDIDQMKWVTFDEIIKLFYNQSQIESSKIIWSEFGPVVDKVIFARKKSN